MKAIAIDDEPIALEIISSHAAKVPFLQLEAVFTDAFKALEYLQHESIDVLFLDIKMPDISGIDFFNSLSKKPLLIFTTAYSEHAATSFDMDAVDYLLKPITLARFIKACNKVNELYQYRNEEETADYIYVKTGYDQVKIMFSDILYVEAAGNYVSFVLKQEKILSRSTFAEATTMLPPQQFVRVHRSFMIAVNKINKIEKGQLIIEGKEIPVSEGYLQALQEAIKKQQP